MKKIGLLSLVIFLISVSACSKSIRYSQEEIKDFSPSIQEHIKKGEITIGMTTIQVRYSWGGPDQTIVLAPGELGKERLEWIYTSMHFLKSRLIFTDNRLTEIISSEPGIAK